MPFKPQPPRVCSCLHKFLLTLDPPAFYVQAKDTHTSEAMRAEMLELRPSVLEKRAREAGASEELLEEAKDAEDPKQRMVQLIMSMSHV